ncbi:hypothetical protein MESS4_340209 [Mesorhizobium sp. STM 4661]|nr:hypothetical protein MESS4_340209 [Mesorhizobium sp. STM 4661]
MVSAGYLAILTSVRVYAPVNLIRFGLLSKQLGRLERAGRWM